VVGVSMRQRGDDLIRPPPKVIGVLERRRGGYLT